MDARTASYEATGGAAEPLLPRVLPAAAPGRHRASRARTRDGAACGSSSPTARSAARCGCSCARCAGCPRSCRGRPSSTRKTGAVPTLRSSLRNRVHVVDDEDAAFAGADVVVAASLGQVTAPGVLVQGARRRRRARWPRACRSTRRCCATATSGCTSSSATSTCSPQQLERAACATTRCAPSSPRAGAAAREELSLVARRRRGRGDLRAARRAAPRPGPEARGPRAARQAQADRSRPAHAHRPLERLRDAGRRAAGHRPRRRPGRDRGHRPQRDLRRPRRRARRPPSTASR